ncbi:MAG TPA: nucleotidyltransferase family protein [Streptosporangiaceae bacterium]|jgi:hypothetical protein
MSLNPRVRAVLSMGALAPAVSLENSLAAVDADRAGAAALLRRHKVLQLAASRFEDAPGAAATALREALSESIAAARKRTVAITAVLGVLADVGASVGVSVAGMKGVAARMWYPDPELRDVTDVDAWVADAEESVQVQQRLRAGYGYRFASFELPWFKKDDSSRLYGVLMLEPTRDDLTYVDVHFGAYSVRHCASFVPSRPRHVQGSPIPLLEDEDNLCCTVANAAGDHFVDMKTLNDLYLCLAKPDFDWARVRRTLGSVGLLGSLDVMLGRLTELYAIDESVRAGLDAVYVAGALPREPAPHLEKKVWRRRTAVTVRHAYGIGRRASLPSAVKMAASAYRYYRRPLRPALAGAGRGGRPFRLEVNPWTCVRLLPTDMVGRLLEEDGAGNAAEEVTGKAAETVPAYDLAPGITVIPTAAGDLVTLSGEPFLPTVMYRIEPGHARAALDLAGQTATKSHNGA